jgi:hypothetical protein
MISQKRNQIFQQVSSEQKRLIVLIGIFVSTNTFLILLHLGKILTYFFPASAFIVALILSEKSRSVYVGFCIWILFSSPLIRRFADYYSSWTDPSPVLLAPYLVYSASFLYFSGHLLKNKDVRYNLPFFLCLTSTLYAFTTGFLQGSPKESLIAFLSWASPISVGFMIFSDYVNYSAYQKIVKMSFFIGCFLMGVYGIYQYVSILPWDSFWMENTYIEKGFNVIGKPLPYEVRVFSTLASPQPFAAVMKASLLILCFSHTPLSVASFGIGLISFFLSSARSAWVSFVFSALVLMSVSKPSQQFRFIRTIVIIILLLVPFSKVEPFSSSIQERLMSFQDIQSDTSYLTRMETFNSSIDQTLSQIVGAGIGKDIFAGDQGVLTILYSLGWIGAIPFLAGIVILGIFLLDNARKTNDDFVKISIAISVGTLQQLISNVSVAGESGLIFWLFTSLAMAGVRHQNLLLRKSKLTA